MFVTRQNREPPAAVLYRPPYCFSFEIRSIVIALALVCFSCFWCLICAVPSITPSLSFANGDGYILNEFYARLITLIWD
uniref:Transmembrane protein n=1 Tax=Panagrellus redivivus TaxID=6233 RepID=A0A7E4WBT5_PANRE